MHHHALLIFFCIFSRDGFYHVDQAGLELLTSNDPPASASQSAGFTGVSHSARPCVSLFHRLISPLLFVTILRAILIYRQRRRDLDELRKS